MELVSLAKEVFQNIAEQAASYRMGQSALRYIDRTLWVIEKCARWAVPPPCNMLHYLLTKTVKCIYKNQSYVNEVKLILFY